MGLGWAAEKAELKPAVLKEKRNQVGEVTLSELKANILHSILYIN